MTEREINQAVRDHIGPREADWITIGNARRKLHTLLQRLTRLATALDAPVESSRILAQATDSASVWDLYVLDHIERIGAALEQAKGKRRR